jgi:hypothetical protein
VKVEYWTGPAGQMRPASTTEPKPEPGDSEKKVVTLEYDKKGTAKGEIVLPKLTDPKHVYWMRAVVTDSTDTTTWVLSHGMPIRLLMDRKPVTLKYRPRAGAKIGVEVSNKGALKVRTRTAEKPILSELLVVFIEQVDAENETKEGVRLRQTYGKITIGTRFDGKPITTADKVLPVLNSLMRKTQEVEMDADGALGKVKFDLRKIPREQQKAAEGITDQVQQCLPLMTVSLPEGTLEPLQTWKAQRRFKVGSLRYSLPARARLEYTYLGLRTRGSKTDAVIEMKGALSGTGTSKEKVAGTLSGLYFLSSETGEVIEAQVKLRVELDVSDEDGPARLVGDLETSLKRGPLVIAKPAPRKPN